MAVLVEAISVIINYAKLDEHWPGGFVAFRDAAPNETLCSDGELLRLGFMAPVDAERFVRGMGRHGLVYLENEKARDIAIADQQRGFMAPCEWAEFGRIAWLGNKNRMIGACRLKASSISQVFVPEGWTWENSLTASFRFRPTGESDSLDLLGREAGVDVFVDPITGKRFFTGRVEGD